MEENKKIYSCNEHIDMAIDDYVNTYEVAPNIEICKDKKCNYCQEKSEYVVSE